MELNKVSYQLIVIVIIQNKMKAYFCSLFIFLIFLDCNGSNSKTLIAEVNSFEKDTIAGQSIAAKAYGSKLEYSYSIMRESYQDSLGDHQDEVLFWDLESPDTFIGNSTYFIAQRYDSIVIQGEIYYDALRVVTAPPSLHSTLMNLSGREESALFVALWWMARYGNCCATTSLSDRLRACFCERGFVPWS